MIKRFTLFLILLTVGFTGYCQTEILAEWNFDDSNPLIDNAGPGGMNSGKNVTSNSSGSTTYSAGASGQSFSRNGWVGGNGSMYHHISISTVGYGSITISSKQRGSGTGPKDFKIQYKVGTGAWTDITGGSIVVADNFTSGVKNDLAVPTAAANQPIVEFRWLMSSNTAISSSIGAAGTNRIDDIIIKGTIVVSRTINLTDLSASSFCQVSEEHLAEFSTTGFTGSNTFTLQLSNASGSFAAPTNLGTLSTSTASGNLLEFDMPIITAGSSYKVRLINATTISNEMSISILSRPGGSILALNNTSSSDEMCPGEQAIIKYVNSGAGSLFDIKINGVTYTSIENGDEIIVSPALNSTTNYTLQQIINDDGCVIAIP